MVSKYYFLSETICDLLSELFSFDLRVSTHIISKGKFENIFANATIFASSLSPIFSLCFFYCLASSDVISFLFPIFYSF